ncbi:ATP-binding protein [Oligoflexus tunisiensis]|uniref:ATP-binding protein n=1 Tax=Oligoflexus tunisiensis TaxID=708132 RepID=UPI000A4878C6|nr:ATP-binding protein [Oligoflexus tunisiensis]
MAQFEKLRWHQSLGFKTQIAVLVLGVWVLGGIVLVMKSMGTEKVLEESRRLIEQTGNNAVGDLQNRLIEVDALARTFAETSKVLPKDDKVIHNSLPPLVNFQGDNDVAGGGFWPEPYAFHPKKERSSFFWGRNKDGQLEFFDDYNKPGAGYHHEEWYVVVRYAQRGKCFWSRSYMDPYSYQPMTTCTVGIFDQDKFMGEVTIDVKLEGLHALAKSWQKKTGGYVFIMDRNNKFLTFPNVDLVKKIGQDDKGNRTEDFVMASDLAQKEPHFAPIAQALDAMNQDILTTARSMPGFNPTISTKVDEDSYQIDEKEAEFINAITMDPLNTRTQQTKLYQSLELDRDFVTGSRSLAYIFHVPSSYWKVVVVKPLAEAAAVADSITRMLILYLVMTVGAVGLLASWLLYRMVLMPLKQTTASIQEMGELIQKNDTDRIPRTLTEKLPHNEIGLLKSVFHQLTVKVLDARVSLEDYSKQLEKMNSNLEERVKERSRALQTILNNVQSGFLLVNRDGEIQEGFTKSCQNLFDNRVRTGMLLSKLLNMKPAHAGYYQLAISEIFEDIMPEEVTTEQLPQRFHVGDKALRLVASAVRNETGKVELVLFTITDVTALEQAEMENININAVLGILRQREAFGLFLTDARRSLAELKAKDAMQDQARARAILHTLKGNCGAFGLVEMARTIHQIEDELVISIDHVHEVEGKLKDFLMANYQLLSISYEEEVGSWVQLDQNSIKSLEQRVGRVGTLDDARRELALWIQTILMKNARDLVGPLPDFVKLLAERLDKKAELEIIGGDVRLDSDVFAPVLQNLTHLIRNSVDHGLEAPDERGTKPPVGHLRLTFIEAESGWTLKLADDGKGINTQAVVQKAIDSGLVQPEEVARMSEQEKLELIFRDGLSTAERVSDISGRGVGMSAVARSLEAVGGTIHVSSRVGEGTEFELWIPRAQKGVGTRRVA